jgi:hypothetical protein
MLGCRKILIFADDPRVISMGVQRAEPVDTRKDDVFRRLRLALPARKQRVVTIQRRLRKLQALLFCSARHIGKANPFGGGITLKTATLRGDSATLCESRSAGVFTRLSVSASTAR